MRFGVSAFQHGENSGWAAMLGLHRMSSVSEMAGAEDGGCNASDMKT